MNSVIEAAVAGDTMLPWAPSAIDIVIVDDLTAKLRAERAGSGNGRIHTLAWEATNACGAAVTATATVTVPR